MSPRRPEPSVQSDRKRTQLSQFAGIKYNEQGGRKSGSERGIRTTEPERWQSFLSALDDLHRPEVELTHLGGKSIPNAKSNREQAAAKNDRDRAAGKNDRVKPADEWDQERPADKIEILPPVGRKGRGQPLDQNIGAPSPDGGFIWEDKYCKQLLGQIYLDIHAASTPGVIQATADLPHHISLDGTHFSTQNWIQSNLALHTRAVFKVIEYAVTGLQTHNHRFITDVYIAANSVRLQPDNGLGRVEKLAQGEVHLTFRYSRFVIDHGLMMLSILATSAAFREAARSLDEATWNLLGKYISNNFISLEYFAKIRGLDWQAAPRRLPQCEQIILAHLRERYPGITADHPHTYVVPQSGWALRPPQCKNRDQINVLSNQFCAATFGQYPAPLGWPITKRYPSDPMITRAQCHICGKTGCACDPLDCAAVTRPLVEIVHYGERGNGIRVLQPIKKGDILDEYVGEIQSIYGIADDVYSFVFEISEGFPLAYVSSERVGNWTRFINHSCNASASFEVKVIGRRWRVMIVATRNVDVFEELTVDYGDGYWVGGKRLCKCKSLDCRFNTWKKILKAEHMEVD